MGWKIRAPRWVKKALPNVFGKDKGGGGSMNPTPIPNRPKDPVDGLFDNFKHEAERSANEALAPVASEVPKAAEAIARFAGRNLRDRARSLSSAERRLREGKFVDAMWHLATDPARNTEKNAAKAVQESALVRAGAQYAASIAFGPAGVAAFAAWATYRESGGDVELALRAAAIEGAKSWAIGKVDAKYSDVTSDEVAQKAILVGAIGGVAVAASGGTIEDVGKGFLASGGAVLVLDGYRESTGRSLGDDALRTGRDGYRVAVDATGAFIMTIMGGEEKAKPSDGDPLPSSGMQDAGAPLREGEAAGEKPQGLPLPGEKWQVGWVKQYLGNPKIPAIVLMYEGATPLYSEEEQKLV